MPFCAVAGCRTSSRNRTPDVTFHRFPKNAPSVTKIWSKRCHRKTAFNIENSFICSKHFRSEDFQTSLLREEFGLGGRWLKRLEKGAVPSLNLPFTPPTEKVNKARAERQEKRARRALVNELLADYEKKLKAKSDNPTKANPNGTKAKELDPDTESDNSKADDAAPSEDRDEPEEAAAVDKGLARTGSAPGSAPAVSSLTSCSTMGSAPERDSNSSVVIPTVASSEPSRNSSMVGSARKRDCTSFIVAPASHGPNRYRLALGSAPKFNVNSAATTASAPKCHSNSAAVMSSAPSVVVESDNIPVESTPKRDRTFVTPSPSVVKPADVPDVPVANVPKRDRYSVVVMPLSSAVKPVNIPVASAPKRDSTSAVVLPSRSVTEPKNIPVRIAPKCDTVSVAVMPLPSVVKSVNIAVASAPKRDSASAVMVPSQSVAKPGNIPFRIAPKCDSVSVVGVPSTVVDKPVNIPACSLPKRDNPSSVVIPAAVGKAGSKSTHITRKYRSVPVRDNATVAAEAAASYAGSHGIRQPLSGTGSTSTTCPSPAIEVMGPDDSRSDDDDLTTLMMTLMSDDETVPDEGSDGKRTVIAEADAPSCPGGLVTSSGSEGAAKSVTPADVRQTVPVDATPAAGLAAGSKITGRLAFKLPPGAAGVTLSTLPAASPREQSRLLLERMMELRNLRATVQDLEEKCIQVLTTPGVRATAAKNEDAEAVEKQENPAEASSVSPSGEPPLMVLREERRIQTPAMVTRMRQHELPDSVVLSTPLGMEEALEMNHRLKVQFLSLQAAMLRWAIRNKQLRDFKRKQADRKRMGRPKQTVPKARLRELLRLEAAVKAMFTDAQIRALTRENTSDTDKRKARANWGEEDLRRVLELRAISSDRVVDHVRDKMKIPLPSMVTTKNRCKKTPELREAYRAMLAQSERNQNRCVTCDHQENVIDEVVNAVNTIPPSDRDRDGGDAPFGHQFVQRVPPDSRHGPAPGRQKKRRRPAAKESFPAKKARPPVETLPPDWLETSDSDAGPPYPSSDLWDRLTVSDYEWPPGEPPDYRSPSPGLARPGPAAVPQRRAWR